MRRARHLARRRLAFPVPVAAVVLLLAASTASAHKHPNAAAADSSVARTSAAPATSTQVAAGDSSNVHGDGAAGAAAGRVPAAPVPYRMPPMREALREHLHNKLVHFPLALAVAAALVLALGRRRPDVELAGRWLVWLAALGGVAAYLTGRLQEEMFAGEPKEWLVDLHQRWGTASAIVLATWALLVLWRPARRHAWLIGLVAAALVLVTGFYGGIVAHGE